MRVVPIAELLQMDDGEKPPSFKGKVKYVNKRHTGTNSKGPWSLQTLVITDGKSDIYVKLDHRAEAPANLKGRELHFMCSEGSKGLNGLKMETDNYDPKNPRKQVKVTKTGSIVMGNAEICPYEDDASEPTGEEPQPDAPPGDEGVPAEQEPPPKQQEPPAKKSGPPMATKTAPAKTADSAPTTTVQAPPPQTQHAAADPWAEINRHVKRLFFLRQRTLAATFALAEWSDKELKWPLTPDHLQAIDSWLAIAIEKQMGIHDLPLTAFKKPEDKNPQQ